MQDSGITELCGTKTYMNHLSLIDFSNNLLEKVCSDFVQFVKNHTSIVKLKLENNKLTSLPNNVIEKSNLSLTLSGNRFHCSCDMIWMVDWLGNATTSNGYHAVQDYKEVTCYSGQMIGTPIYKLKALDMGCYPHVLARWTVITLSCIGSILLILLSLLGISIKRWNDIRWLIYKYFNKFIQKWNNTDDLDHGVLFDAYLSYR